ncbi:MAG TPA: ABC transporter ATP-binding protein [Candidatus Caldiarchaeum subterraneum]|uniref:ABC transporter ATP-binding protein n=1 Tax=Caldiarchaeum subterraneum TaxID=311458 RepID=A0A833EAE0_CALS0|nr:ABC transporter ATP-binding protein [Aigarchaeota archaeon]HIQ29610.1 ABC transporter ATP-binding protein [Candidatus Caldarchaeum subterraneum]
MPSILSLRNVCSGYGKLQVLWDVSLEAEKGDIIALVGANGAGKTTTLRTIIGLVKPWSGDITLNGERINRLPTHEIIKKGLALVPEGRELFPKMSVYENLLMGARMLRDKKKIEDTMEWVYGLFPILKERRKQAAYTLSGGEQQMLAIGRALMSKPSLLMIDELSTGLAPLIVAKIFDILKRLNREENLTLLLVEQNVKLALEASYKAYILERGRVTISGESNEILKNPEIVKAYIGG